MAEATWEKPQSISLPAARAGRGRLKFLVGGALILVAVIYLIISSTSEGARFFITVKELVNDPAYVGKTVRISGAVIGDSIKYDESDLVIDFSIANIPNDYTNLGEALHQSVNDPNSMRIPVRVVGQVKPDLLKHEAQAILTGVLDKNGVFQASELLLKCPTRFQDAKPGEELTKPNV